MDIKSQIIDDEKRIEKLRKNPVAKTKYDFFTVIDGIKLFYRYFEPEGEIKKVVLAMHGLAGHSGMWTMLGDSLYYENTIVYVPDVRGHGRSGGIKGNVDNFDDVVEDYQEFVKMIKTKHPDIPLFIVGESMGGAVGINYCAKYQDEIQGAVICAPGIRLAKAGILQILSHIIYLPVYIFYLIFYPQRPIIKVKGKEELGTRNPHHIEYDRYDPVHLDKISVRLILSFFKFINKILKDSVYKITIPVLVFQGDNDKLVDANATYEFHRKLPSKDKTLKVIKGAYHCIYTDPASDEMYNTIGEWIKNHT